MTQGLLCLPPPAWTRTRGVAHKAYTWAKDPAVDHWCDIHVRFLAGSEWQQAVVREVVTAGWNAVCGAQFRFGDRYTAPVRVAFEPGASWSQPGNYGVDGPFDVPTLNLGWVREDIGTRELGRVILHEFGHALALQHEHQHPGVAIPWNRPALYAIYRRTNGWPPDVVESQVLQVIAAEAAAATEYDPASIMGYPIDPDMVLDPAWAHERSYSLSDGDVATVRWLYGPPPAREGVEAFLPIVKG